mmetsp:Transcript_17080/g.49032  ORF Transcript_17080/g.49032 Transcript_17080/m.49032 type:complete len:163 (-) Transcript_17080:74-562(-)
MSWMPFLVIWRREEMEGGGGDALAPSANGGSGTSNTEEDEKAKSADNDLINLVEADGSMAAAIAVTQWAQCDKCKKWQKLPRTRSFKTSMMCLTRFLWPCLQNRKRSSLLILSLPSGRIFIASFRRRRKMPRQKPFSAALLRHRWRVVLLRWILFGTSSPSW